MPKKSVIAAIICGLALLGGFSATALAQQSSQAPVAPLAPSDMTPSELATYQSLGNDPTAQMSFRDTRAFLRLCGQVEAGTLPPDDLPFEPRDYDKHYVSASEQHIVDDAIYKNVDALTGISGPTPAQRNSSVQIVPLAPSNMTPAERAMYQGLGNEPAAEMSFRDTRAYLRLCRQAEAGKLPVKNLPTEPGDYDKRFLSPSELRIVNDAAFKQIMSWQ